MSRFYQTTRCHPQKTVIFNKIYIMKSFYLKIMGLKIEIPRKLIRAILKLNFPLLNSVSNPAPSNATSLKSSTVNNMINLLHLTVYMLFYTCDLQLTVQVKKFWGFYEIINYFDMSNVTTCCLHCYTGCFRRNSKYFRWW
jgi:hypothetical protein